MFTKYLLVATSVGPGEARPHEGHQESNVGVRLAASRTQVVVNRRDQACRRAPRSARAGVGRGVGRGVRRGLRAGAEPRLRRCCVLGRAMCFRSGSFAAWALSCSAPEVPAQRRSARCYPSQLSTPVARGGPEVERGRSRRPLRGGLQGALSRPLRKLRRAMLRPASLCYEGRTFRPPRGSVTWTGLPGRRFSGAHPHAPSHRFPGPR